MKKLLIFSIVSMFAVGSLLAGFPAGPGDDNTTSLGTYQIYISPKFQPLFAGYFGYDPVTQILESPLLFDGATVIGRSDVFLHGDPADATGVPVGTAGTMIGDGNFTIVPPGFQGPNQTREIHTEVYYMNLVDLASLGVAVRAGPASGRPMSPGEVQADHPSDFPAKSFFDVFVEVDIPDMTATWGLNMLVINDIALMVEDDNLLSLPPRVVYIHKNSTAVPVRFINSNATSTPPWVAGEVLGFLVLAGHGIEYVVEDSSEFMEIMDNVPLMPLPMVPSTTPVGLLILLALIIVTAVYVLYKKRATSHA